MSIAFLTRVTDSVGLTTDRFLTGDIFDRSPVSNGVTTEEARRGTSSPMSVQFAAFSIDNNGLQRDKDRKNTNNHKVRNFP